MKKKADEDDRRFVARNKKARFRYEVVDRLEAGISLVGTEVKSLRAGRVALLDSFAKFRGGELYLVNCHIATYDHAHRDNHEPTRARKLLLRKREIRRLKTKVEERGHTVIPLSIYFVRGLAKVELGLCRGKRS
ncbi:MAG: SsrA-binding protein, partial [Gammaproteobacteria bacterium]